MVKEVLYRLILSGMYDLDLCVCFMYDWIKLIRVY